MPRLFTGVRTPEFWPAQKGERLGVRLQYPIFKGYRAFPSEEGKWMIHANAETGWVSYYDNLAGDLVVYSRIVKWVTFCVGLGWSDSRVTFQSNYYNRNRGWVVSR